MKYKKNADGTDMLDENGNPIPDQTSDGQGGESITVEEFNKMKTDFVSVLNEVKDLRVKNREMADIIENKKPADPIPGNQDDEIKKIAGVVKAVLNEDKMSQAQTNKKVAFDKFVELNKEFHPENDPTGVKRTALETKFKQFSLEGVSSEADFYSAIEEAHILLRKNDNSSTTYSGSIQNPYSSTPKIGITPQSTDKDDLSPREKKLVERGSVTKERILKLRETNPSYLESLLAYVRD